MVGDFTYDNWTQGRFLVDGEWKEGIFHGEEFIDLKGNVYRLDQVDDENIVECMPWKELIYK